MNNVASIGFLNSDSMFETVWQLFYVYRSRLVSDLIYVDAVKM